MAHCTIVSGPSKDRLQNHFFNKKMERPDVYFVVTSNLNDSERQLTFYIEISSLEITDELRDEFTFRGKLTDKPDFPYACGTYDASTRTGAMSMSPTA